MWIAAHGHILTLDNLMLCGHTLANCCCKCCCNQEYADHLLISCSVAHSLWMFMLRLLGIDWVMPGSVADLFFCWYHWLGKHNSDIWNLVLRCLMWTIQIEQNWHSFEDIGKSLAQLLDLYQWTLFDWSQCWGLSDCSTLMNFFFCPLEQLSVCLFLFSSFISLFTIVNVGYFSCFSFFNNIFSYL